MSTMLPGNCSGCRVWNHQPRDGNVAVQPRAYSGLHGACDVSTILVTPIVDRFILQVGHEFVENQVFPEWSMVGLTQSIPPAEVRREIPQRLAKLVASNIDRRKAVAV